MEAAHRESADAAVLSAILGRGSTFDGKLRFEGTVRIDGTFTGEITAQDTLIVGEGGKVSATITCRSVVVYGDVTGDIFARDSVELRAPARVKGDITTPSLVMEKGAVFEGRSMMEDATRSTNVIRMGRGSAEVASR
ncbi:MAG: polymer-forming cytoskeletal protein [Chloroflexota bacterium]|nr:polymer-forming cytoskeletal protein [Chloroflexota bacterium]